MPLPPLLHYERPADYRKHFERVYCRGVIQTFDGIRAYFQAHRFEHAFYESSNRDGRKDRFSQVRAERIDWIKATLEHPQAQLFAGWNKKNRTIDNTRRVAVVYEDFVVVISIGLRRNGTLKANFVTCYQADNSIDKIKSSPTWDQAACVATLQARRQKQEGR